MSNARRIENRLLSASERELVDASHYPALCDLSDQELGSLLNALRERRDRARDIARRQRREMRGKARPSGTAAASDNSGTKAKLSVLASAVRRINTEVARRKRFSAKESLKANAQKALDMRKASLRRKRPPPGRTADEGMHPVPNERPPELVNRMEVGRVSQFVKDAQAKRDSR